MAAASSFGSYVATFGPHVAPIRSLLGHIALLSGVTPPTWVLPHWEVDVANSEKCSHDTQNLYLSVGGIISRGIGGGVSKAIGPSLNNFAPGIHSRWGRAHRLPPIEYRRWHMPPHRSCNDIEPQRPNRRPNRHPLIGSRMNRPTAKHPS
jgi:hypothetical protein